MRRWACRARRCRRAVLRMVGLVGARSASKRAPRVLAQTGRRGGADQTRRARGRGALARDRGRRERRGVEPPRADEPLAPTLYLGMDGTGVRMRLGRDGPHGQAARRGGQGARGQAVRRRGAPRAETRRARRCAIRAPDQLLWRAMESRGAASTDAAPGRVCAAGSSGRPCGAGSTAPLGARRHSATARSGSGTSPPSTSPTPTRSLPLPRRATLDRRRQGHLRTAQRRGQAVGAGAPRRNRRGHARRDPSHPADPRRRERHDPQVRRVHRA